MTTMTISLPDQIAQQVDTETKSKGFSTRSEFIRSLLRHYFHAPEIALETFTPEPIDQIRLQLAQTGKYSEEFINSVIKGLNRSSFYDSQTPESRS